MSCSCGDSWEFISVDSRTGIIRAVLDPISADWETRLNDVGQGTVTLATSDVNVRDIWPNLATLYILRTAGDDASVEAPVAEFAGMIETVNATTEGTTQLGLRSIENYLFKRTIKRNMRFDQVGQNRIAEAIHREALPNGIQLDALAEESLWLRDRSYKSWSRKNIGEAIQQLTQIIGGPDWELRHFLDNTRGTWSSQMVYRDRVGEDRGVHLKSDVESLDYALTISSDEQSTHVDAIGNGEGSATLIATSEDESGIYPQIDSAPAWKDVSRMSTLRDHSRGYLEEHQEPYASPSVTLRGLFPEPSSIRLGDTLTIETNFGAVTYNGPARVIGISWALGVDEPETRTLETIPLARASEAVLNQEPTEPCEDC